MGLILYELGGLDDRRYSLFAWRSRMALAHKGLAAEYRPVRISDKAAIAFSAQTKVPILTDGDTVVVDSWKIAEYLETACPGGPSLFGGAVGQGLAKFINVWTDRQIVPAVAGLVACDIGACVDAVDAAYLRAVMEKGLGKTLEAMRAERGERVAVFRRLLDPARVVLRGQPYLSGSHPAYADYILFSVFQWARIVSEFELLEGGDAVRAWCERVLDLFDGLARRAPARLAA
jgi:glutathione S-transferase